MEFLAVVGIKENMKVTNIAKGGPRVYWSRDIASEGCSVNKKRVEIP